MGFACGVTMYIVTLLSWPYSVEGRLYRELAWMLSLDVGKLYVSLSLAKRVVAGDTVGVRELVERYFKLGSEKFVGQEFATALERVYRWAEAGWSRSL